MKATFVSAGEREARRVVEAEARQARADRERLLDAAVALAAGQHADRDGTDPDLKAAAMREKARRRT